MWGGEGRAPGSPPSFQEHARSLTLGDRDQEGLNREYAELCFGKLGGSQRRASLVMKGIEQRILILCDSITLRGIAQELRRQQAALIVASIIK